MLVDVAEPKAAALGPCPVCGHENVRELMKAPDRFHGRSQLYSLVRCQSCSLVWTHNPPLPDEMEHHYGPDYNRLIAAAGEGSPNRWRDRHRTLFQYKTSGRLLDLGCSSGSFLASLKSSSWDLSGIEMSPESAKRARNCSGAQVFVGDILDAPFEECAFDVVTCFDVFEHLYQPHKVMKKVWHWLKPGGVFYLTVPNIDSAGANVFGSYWYALELPRHLYHFSPASMRHLVKSTGFEEVSITTRRDMFMEHSVRYLLADVWRKLGASHRTLATAKTPSIPWTIGRKIVRMMLFQPLSSLGFIVGDGEAIEIVLQKRSSPAHESNNPHA